MHDQDAHQPFAHAPQPTAAAGANMLRRLLQSCSLRGAATELRTVRAAPLTLLYSPGGALMTSSLLLVQGLERLTSAAPVPSTSSAALLPGEWCGPNASRVRAGQDSWGAPWGRAGSSSQAVPLPTPLCRPAGGLGGAAATARVHAADGGAKIVQAHHARCVGGARSEAPDPMRRQARLRPACLRGAPLREWLQLAASLTPPSPAGPLPKRAQASGAAW